MKKFKRNSFSDRMSPLAKKSNPVFIKQFLPVYSLIFSILVFILITAYNKEGLSLVRNGDANYQHLKALTYYSNYIKEIFTVLFTEGKFVLPQWDFNVGMGSDIFNTFAYYSFGDPFNFLSFLCPEKYIYIYYQAAMILRFYVSGIAFAYLCFNSGIKNAQGIIAGALTYCFSSYAVFAGLRHPYFINPMIFLPLVIAGTENIIRKRSPLVFTVAVALSALSNFYFFYMIVILTVIYVAVRLITLYRTNVKAICLSLINIGIFSVTGVLMGAVFFLPTIVAFLNDNRTSVDLEIDKFYGDGYFGELLLSFFQYGKAATWLSVCLSVIFLPCLILLFIKVQKNLHLKILYIISLIFMSFPIFGSFMNGFSYVSHRWCFGYVLLMAFIIAKMWNVLIREKQALLLLSGITLTVCLIVLFIVKDKQQITLPFVLLGIVFLLTIVLNEDIIIFSYNKNGKKFKANPKIVSALCLILTVASIINYNYFMITPSYGKYMNEFRKTDNAKNTYYESDAKVLSAAGSDESFWRYSGNGLNKNTSGISGVNSTQFYWSLSNGNIASFREEMNMAEYLLYSYEGFDSRTALNALASVKYFYSKKPANAILPYGYEPFGDSVYINNYALPLGYTYDSYVSRDYYDSLENSAEKQEVLLGAALLETETDLIEKVTPVTTAQDLGYNTALIKGKGEIRTDGFYIEKNKTQLELTFNAVPGSETYFSVEGLKLPDVYVNQIDFTLTSTDVYGNSKTRTFSVYTKNNNFYSAREDFDVNLGYSESGICKVNITFPYAGTYKFDKFSLVSQSMNDYEESITALKEDVLENAVIDYNNFTGTISLEKAKLLCLSIPYSKGWTAYVDGEKAELLKTNGMYSGLLLEKGEHEITLKYSTPYLKIGFIISLLGIGILILLMKVHGKRKGEAENTPVEIYAFYEEYEDYSDEIITAEPEAERSDETDGDVDDSEEE